MTDKRNKLAEGEIDALMKTVFDKLAAEPVPDRFTTLLDQLRLGDVPPEATDGDD